MTVLLTLLSSFYWMPELTRRERFKKPQRITLRRHFNLHLQQVHTEAIQKLSIDFLTEYYKLFKLL